MINKDKLRMFIVNGIGSVIGEDYDCEESGCIKLYHPLRIIPYQGDLVIASLFIKEEWAIIHRSNSVEVSITDEMKNAYVDKESTVFSSIVVPPEKKIII